MTDRDLTRAEVERNLRLFDQPDEDSTLESAQEWLERKSPTLAAQLLRCMDERDEAVMQSLADLGQAQEAYDAQQATEQRVATLEAENARLREAIDSAERLVRNNKTLAGLHVLQDARAALKPVPIVTAGWPTEGDEGSIIVGEVKGDSHD